MISCSRALPLTSSAWSSTDDASEPSVIAPESPLFQTKESFFRRHEEQDDDGSANNMVGPNWIERSVPVLDTGEPSDTLIDFNLGISGKSYQTGPLSARMYQAMVQRSTLLKDGEDDDDSEDARDLRRMLQIYAMDFTAKEAVRAALQENGLEMVLTEDQEQMGLWGMVDSVRLLQEDNSPGRLYEDWEDAVDDWTPGQGFDFIVRQVPSKVRALSLDELLLALDPKGELREQAKEAGMSLPSGDMPQTLADLASDNVRRVEATPREAVTDERAFAGKLEQRGYRPIHASALASLNDDGTISHAVKMHVMDSLVSHGCLLVDLTNGGEDYDDAKVVARMWKTAEQFFDLVDREELPEDLHGMTTAEEFGSPHAKVGFASYNEGNIQFLETRLARTGKLLPTKAEAVLGAVGCQDLASAFRIFADLAKDVTRTVVATCNEEVGALKGTSAIRGATFLVNELMDDATPIQTDVEHSEVSVSMSPHRLCRYSNGSKVETSERNEPKSREIFGAHTDSTFITVVPVALVPGLEVYDEAEEKWYRPEKAARIQWENEERARDKDTTATTEVLEDGTMLPWCARYAIMIPGELLQLVSRSEVLAAVHRVVVTQEQSSRLSAPILVRGRSGISMNATRYLGGTLGEPILVECEGMKLRDIHDKMQARPS
jgi:hypothetical protein